MIHVTEYINTDNPMNNTGFIEVLNCKDEQGKPVVYAKQFDSVAKMNQRAIELKELFDSNICYKSVLES